MATRTIHLMHSSMLKANSDADFKADLAFMFDQEPDVISFTEMASFHDALREGCKGTNYTPVFLTQNPGEAFAVRSGEKQIGVKDRGAVQAHPGDEAGAGHGGYPPRYVNWVKINFFGETVYYHTAHWVAHLADFNSPQRVKRANLMSQQMAIQVRKHGVGDALSFFSGDTNQDDKEGEDKALGKINTVFRNADLLTVWDEFSVYPPTFDNRTIDVIGSFVPDKRVKAARYKVWPRQKSDHRFISTWYEITPAKKPTTGGGGGQAGGGGDTGPKDPDFYATGGNVDWSDYADGEVYDLPSAVDDSDGSNH